MHEPINLCLIDRSIFFRCSDVIEISSEMLLSRKSVCRPRKSSYGGSFIRMDKSAASGGGSHLALERQ